jgi:LmbE family N-acetylglucosaminyl deacetylase
VNFVMFGAHPDDCEICGGGTAARLVRQGHRVTLVSVTNGDRGHQSLPPRALARVRRAEARAAAEALGVESLVLDVHDCHVVPSVELRERLVGIIRERTADVVISHRPNDYHPDHRNTGLVVQDTAYLAIVPLFCPRVPALRVNPVYLYFQDSFKAPNPFRADVVVPIDGVFDAKVEALHRMPSQVYEWLPWTMDLQDRVPGGEAGRRAWARSFLLDHMRGVPPAAITGRFGAPGKKVRLVEAFQLCEYGRQPPPAELRGMFPGLEEKPKRRQRG